MKLLMVPLFVLAAGLAFGQEPTPTIANQPYGPHERNVLDFWKAEGEGPRPLVVYIHGGGWTQGDKAQPADRYLPYLEHG